MPNRIARSFIGLIALANAVGQVRAPLEFEVASVKPNKANDRIVTIQVGPGGRFMARGYTLKLLIQRAYGVMGFNISGGPGWLDTDRYDVAATAIVPGNLAEAQLQPMLRAMLADRFQLKLHDTTKEMSAYALVVAKGGPKLTASSGPENSDTFRMGGTGITGQGIGMQTFARFVGGKLGLIVVDQTGLQGIYDFKVQWTVEMDNTDARFDMRDAMRPVAFAALQNQLGLKLNAQKVPVRMLVIDTAEKASEN